MITLDEMKDNNHFFDLLIKLNSITDKEIAINEIECEIKNRNNIYEKISLFHLQAEFYIQVNKIKKSFNSFIQAELSLIKKVSLKNNISMLVDKILLDYCKRLKLHSIDQLIDNINKKYQTQTLIENIYNINNNELLIWFKTKNEKISN